jgi:hypothetical protein
MNILGRTSMFGAQKKASAKQKVADKGKQGEHKNVSAPNWRLWR